MSAFMLRERQSCQLIFVAETTINK